MKFNIGDIIVFKRHNPVNFDIVTHVGKINQSDGSTVQIKSTTNIYVLVDWEDVSEHASEEDATKYIVKELKMELK